MITTRIGKTTIGAERTQEGIRIFKVSPAEGIHAINLMVDEAEEMVENMELALDNGEVMMTFLGAGKTFTVRGRTREECLLEALSELGWKIQE